MLILILAILCILYIPILKYALLSKTSHGGIVGERSRLFMFNEKDKIEKKWRPASSRFKALLHYAGEEAAQRKLQKTRRAYLKERTKQREHLNWEIARLDKLLKEGSIDEDIYPRLKKLLEIGYEQKRRETREIYGFVKKLDADKAA